MKDGFLFISKETDLNTINGDPRYGIPKFLYIKYKVNDWTDCNIYDEKLKDDINFDYRSLEKVGNSHWIDVCDVLLYDRILNSIKFNSKFQHLAFGIAKDIPFTPRVNAIHIRDEDDAIDFWGKINRIPPEDYKKCQVDKYINLIKEYFSIDDIILVITGNEYSQVLDFLKDNNYKYYICPKNLIDGRELTALVDLFFSYYSNNTFIGTVNPLYYTGSSFGYFIWKTNTNIKKAILLDISAIYLPEYVILQ